MPLATCIQYLRVDSTTVVAHHDPKIPACILYFYFYSICLSMQKGVDEGFAADAVYLITDRGSQRAPCAVGDDAVADILVDGGRGCRYLRFADRGAHFFPPR